MHLHQRLAVCLGCISIFCRTAISAPTQPASSNLLHTGSNLSINLPRPFNNSLLCGLGSSATNDLREVAIDHGTWSISDTLSLKVTICNWEPDPVTILAVLAAAESTVGKKPATNLLSQRFVQKSKNKYNTLLFEIAPHYVHKILTWSDVGEVLGKNGLLKFFEETGQWHTVYFDMIHTERGELGNGAVRRWWQLEPQVLELPQR